MKIVPVFLLTGLALSAFSQSGNPVKPKGQVPLSFQRGKSVFEISGNYRLRGEVQHNYNVKTYATGENESFLLSRLRLNLEYRFANRLKLFTEFQDAREVGSSFTVTDFQDKNHPFHDPFDINKLYVSIMPSDNLELIFGRQSLNLGNRRVFGPGDWGNTGRYIWDAVNLIYKNKYFNSQNIFGYNIIHQPDVFPNHNREAGNTFASFNTIKNLPFLLEIFYVYKYDKSEEYKSENGTLGNLSSNYLGGRLLKSKNNWNLMFLYSCQFGHFSADQVLAHGVASQLTYNIKSGWQPKIMATYIYGSGDKNPADGKRQTFDGIYSGADTDLYSWMNFSFWKNVHQIRADLVLNPTKRMSFRSEYHAYFLARTTDAWYFPGKAMRIDPTGNSGKFVGHEADFTLNFKPTRWLDLLTGYCLFVPGKFVGNTGESQLASWGFAQLTFSF